VRTGKALIQRVSKEITLKHHEKRQLKANKLTSNHIKLLSSGKAVHKVFAARDGDPKASKNCTNPPPTPWPIPVPTAPPKNLMSDNNVVNPESVEAQIDTLNEQEQSEETSESELQPYPLFIGMKEDPFVNLMTHHYNSLDEEEYCNGPEFTGLFDITDGQILGFTSTFLTNHAEHLCPICHNYMSTLFRGAFHNRKAGLADDEAFVYNTFLSHVPEPETVCSALIPACHEDYEKKKLNITDASKCLECAACNTVSIALMQEIFNEDRRDAWRKTLTEDVFSYICYEMCMVDTPDGNPFDYGDQQACTNFLVRQFDFIFDFLKRFMLPNNFCHKVFGVCKINETPNILHCLKLLCQDVVTPPFDIVCSLVPDEPDDVQRFLNIQKPAPPASAYRFEKTEL